jgi:ferritin
MLSDKMQQALNDQLNAEWYSSYLYVSMAAYFESLALKGFANWMSVQAQEERVHGEMFYNHINSRRGRVVLKAIDAPPTEWKSPLNAFEHVLDHEQRVTGLIDNLVTAAGGENDYATQQFLQWFVSEQVEEEENADAIVRQLTLIGDNPHALLMLDRELARRVFVPPVAAGGGGAEAGAAA